MLHKWEINSYKIKFNINNELKKELEEPKLEKNPKIYSMIIKEKNQEKKIKNIKKLKKKEKSDDDFLLKNKSFNEINKEFSKNNIIESKENDEILKENKINDLIEYDKFNDDENKNDIININEKNNSINFDKELNKSKSVDKFKNISFNVEKPKKWEYSYYRKDNNEDNFTKIKNKKRLMTNLERQQLFNNLYNDCQKRKEKYKKMKIEKEAQFNTLYTFTPKVFQNKLNEKYMKNMADSKFYTKSNSNINITDNNIINNTITSPNNMNNINNKFEENKAEIPLNFISRLSEYEKIKKQNLEKIRNEVYINYVPKKAKKSFDKIINNHLLNNSENFFEIKQRNIEKIKQNMDKEQGITFQPKTNKNINNKIKNSIIERNKEFIKEKQEKLEKYSHMKEKECTFKPKINNIEASNNKENNKQLNASYKTEQNSSDVSKRLFDYQKKYKENLEDIRSKYKENYSFNPIISKNTQSILNNRQKLKEKLEENIINENKNYELIRKQIKLGELEELSKKLEEIKNENLEIKYDLNKKQKTNNINNINKEKISYQNKINKNGLNNQEFINDKENSNKIMQLANNLVSNNKFPEKIQAFDKKENTNDFILLMNNKSQNFPKQQRHNYENDFEKEKGKGSKQIMNLNYYDNLL